MALSKNDVFNLSGFNRNTDFQSRNQICQHCGPQAGGPSARQGALPAGRQGAFGPGVLRAIFTYHYNMLVDKVSAFYKVPSGQGAPSGYLHASLKYACGQSFSLL